ncbi:MAG: glycoside hydrolase [Chloroflexia bacterium]|nr:glycoside hydrolase [Chloroflexia bacterium]
MSIKKQYTKSHSICKVTFSLTKEQAFSASSVNLTGDFNDWDTGSLPMKKSKNGEFTLSIELEAGKEYHFKYLIDGKEWINELEADSHVQNPYMSENSVIVV